MVKSFNMTEVIMLLRGEVPVTCLGPKSKRKRVALTDVARHLKTTPWALRKMIKAFNQGGQAAVNQLKWGRGGNKPGALRDINLQQMNWAAHKGTLY